MHHVAIDLASRESKICVRRDDGTILEEERWPTAGLEGYLQRWPAGSTVILETSAEAFAVAAAARRCGHEVRVVPTTLVRALGVGQRGIKTDQRDAQLLSETSCRMALPSVHQPSETAQQRKALCTAREALLRCRTLLINNVRGYLRTTLTRLPSGQAETFAHRVRAKLGDSATGVPEFIARQLAVLDRLNEQIAAADQELAAIAAADAQCRRLMTAPGVGPLTAVRFVSAIDEVGRFATAHQLESYLGLTPGEDSSGARQRRTHITKAGAPQVRWALVQAAWSVWRNRPETPLVRWAEAVAQRRGRKIASVALARKLAGILYAMWRDGQDYDPRRTAQPELAPVAPPV
jgi:transposase